MRQAVDRRLDKCDTEPRPRHVRGPSACHLAHHWRCPAEHV